MKPFDLKLTLPDFPHRSKTSSCPVAVMRKLRQTVRLRASNTQGCIPREVERLRTDRNYPVNFRTSFFFVENFVICELRELLFYCFFFSTFVKSCFSASDICGPSCNCITIRVTTHKHVTLIKIQLSYR